MPHLKPRLSLESSYRYLLPPPRTPKDPPCAATRILAQYSSRIRACVGSLSIQRQISIPVLVLRTVPVPDLNTGTCTTYCTGTDHPRIRLPVLLRTLYSYSCRFTGDLQIQSRAILFPARSDSNPVLILPLRNWIKTYPFAAPPPGLWPGPGRAAAAG